MKKIQEIYALNLLDNTITLKEDDSKHFVKKMELPSWLCETKSTYTIAQGEIQIFIFLSCYIDTIHYYGVIIKEKSEFKSYLMV